ncbi:MAG: hypothetical protein ACXQS8_05630 [Candidatus Helarchaeales archaeon]
MLLNTLEIEFIKFVVQKPSYFTREALGFLKGTNFEQVIEEFEIGEIQIRNMFQSLLEKALFKHDVIFNGEVFGLERYFLINTNSQPIESPFLVRHLSIFPKFVNEVFIPQNPEILRTFKKEILKNSSNTELIPVKPVVFLRNGQWSRIYYDLSQLEKSENELTRNLGKWAEPPSIKIVSRPFETPKTLSLDKTHSKELDKILLAAGKYTEHSLSMTPTLDRLLKFKAIEPFIDLIGARRNLFRIKMNSSSPEEILNRILQNCFCAEAYLADDEVFVDLRTFQVDEIFNITARANLPYEFSMNQVVKDEKKCNFPDLMKKMNAF